MNNLELPFFYDYENAVKSFDHPIPYYKYDNATTLYFTRYILQKILSNFKITGQREGWEDYYLQYAIFCRGYCAFIDTARYGVIPQICTLTGRNIFYGPRAALIANQLLPETDNREYVIGKDCELVRLSPDYGGIMDICYKYAAEYAISTQSLDVTLINAKLAYIFAAGNTRVAESFKKMMDQLYQGNPAAFIDKSLLDPDGKPSWNIIFADGKGGALANEILTAMEKIDARLNTDIGIPNTNIAKASGVTSDEVNANNKDTATKATLWRDTIQKGFDRVNKMFGIDLKVELAFTDEKGGVEGADQRENNDNGAV